MLQESGEQLPTEVACCPAQLDRMGSSDQLDNVRGSVPDAAQHAEAASCAAGSRTLQVRMVPATKEVTCSAALVILMSHDAAISRSKPACSPFTERTGLCVQLFSSDHGHMLSPCVAQLVDTEFELYKSYQVGQHGEQADEVRPSVQQACCTWDVFAAHAWPAPCLLHHCVNHGPVADYCRSAHGSSSGFWWTRHCLHLRQHSSQPTTGVHRRQRAAAVRQQRKQQTSRSMAHSTCNTGSDRR